jgi:hypothetical protein
MLDFEYAIDNLMGEETLALEQSFYWKQAKVL